MPELIPTADEAAWLEARRKGITASEIAILMGLSPYSSPYALYHQKLGILPSGDDSTEMELGRYLEAFIAARFQQAHPDLYVDGDGRELYAHSEHPWMMATPDRRVYDWRADPDLVHPITHAPVGAVLECKVDGGSDEWGEPGTDEIPVHYRAQVLWQCDVMGVSQWHAACLRWQSRKVVFYEGTVNAAAEEDLALMRAEALVFLDRLRCQDAPDVDWRPATIAALKTMNPDVEDREVLIGRQMAISYRAAVKHAKEAERRKDEMTARVLEAMGNARRAIEHNTDLPVATRSVSHPKRIDTERLRSEQPAIAAEYTKPPKPEVKLTPAKPKKEKKSVSPDSK